MVIRGWADRYIVYFLGARFLDYASWLRRVCHVFFRRGCSVRDLARDLTLAEDDQKLYETATVEK
jgi:hypothetical protein